MAVFMAFLRGENFMLEFDGKLRRMGFYTSRYVRATSLDGAEELAVRLIRKHKGLRKALNIETENRPIVYVERIESRPWIQIFRPQLGLCFWDMDASVA